MYKHFFASLLLTRTPALCKLYLKKIQCQCGCTTFLLLPGCKLTFSLSRLHTAGCFSIKSVDKSVTAIFLQRFNTSGSRWPCLRWPPPPPPTTSAAARGRGAWPHTRPESVCPTWASSDSSLQKCPGSRRLLVKFYDLSVCESYKLLWFKGGYDGTSQSYSPGGSADEDASVGSSADFNDQHQQTPDLISQALENMVKVCCSG